MLKRTLGRGIMRTADEVAKEEARLQEKNKSASVKSASQSEKKEKHEEKTEVKLSEKTGASSKKQESKYKYRVHNDGDNSYFLALETKNGNYRAKLTLDEARNFFREGGPLFSEVVLWRFLAALSRHGNPDLDILPQDPDVKSECAFVNMKGGNMPNYAALGVPSPSERKVMIDNARVADEPFSPEIYEMSRLDPAEIVKLGLLKRKESLLKYTPGARAGDQDSLMTASDQTLRRVISRGLYGTPSQSQSQHSQSSQEELSQTQRVEGRDKESEAEADTAKKNAEGSSAAEMEVNDDADKDREDERMSDCDKMSRSKVASPESSLNRTPGFFSPGSMQRRLSNGSQPSGFGLGAGGSSHSHQHEKKAQKPKPGLNADKDSIDVDDEKVRAKKKSKVADTRVSKAKFLPPQASHSGSVASSEDKESDEVAKAANSKLAIASLARAPQLLRSGTGGVFRGGMGFEFAAGGQQHGHGAGIQPDTTQDGKKKRKR